MRNISARVGALLLPLVALSAAVLVSCAGGHWQSLKLSGGTTVRWTPSDPKIGDLVTVEVSIGTAADRTVSAGPVRGPSGSAIESRAAEFSQGTKKIRWSFRVTTAGTWTIDAGEKRQMLWDVATVSGKATELKKFDGESLWHGTMPKPLPSGAAPANAAQPAQAVSP